MTTGRPIAGSRCTAPVIRPSTKRPRDQVGRPAARAVEGRPDELERGESAGVGVGEGLVGRPDAGTSVG